jgi:hypothetical protein
MKTTLPRLAARVKSAVKRLSATWSRRPTGVEFCLHEAKLTNVVIHGDAQPRPSVIGCEGRERPKLSAQPNAKVSKLELGSTRLGGCQCEETIGNEIGIYT